MHVGSSCRQRAEGAIWATDLVSGASGAVLCPRRPGPAGFSPTELVAGRSVPALHLINARPEPDVAHRRVDSDHGGRGRQFRPPRTSTPHHQTKRKQAVSSPTSSPTASSCPPASRHTPSVTARHRSQWWACHFQTAWSTLASHPGIMARLSAVVATFRSTQHSAMVHSTQRYSPRTVSLQRKRYVAMSVKEVCARCATRNWRNASRRGLVYASRVRSRVSSTLASDTLPTCALSSLSPPERAAVPRRPAR